MAWQSTNQQRSPRPRSLRERSPGLPLPRERSPRLSSRRHTSLRQRAIARAGLLAWLSVMMLVTAIVIDPYAATASPLQLHGALQRVGVNVITSTESTGSTALAATGSPINSVAIDGAGAHVGIISHRGAAALAPENTLAAFRIAIAQGVDFVETDVQLTSDGVPMLMHDPTLDRTTNGHGPVATHTFEQVRTLDAGRWFNAEFAGEPVPTLEEFIDLLQPAPTRAFIELKGEWSEAQVESVIQLMRQNNLVYRVVLESFELPNLEMLQRVAPEFARMLLTRELSDEMMSTAVALQASAVGARETLFDDNPEFVAKIRAAGMGAVVYTLNSEKQWLGAAEKGMDFVITDDPVALAEWRSKRAAALNGAVTR